MLKTICRSGRRFTKLSCRNIRFYTVEQPLVEYKTSKHMAWISLNHLKTRNALSLAMMKALRENLQRAKEDEDVKIVILKANGPVFSAGHDLKELKRSSNEELKEIFKTCSELNLDIRRLPKPVIGMVSGLATAAGCQLIASCDLVIASEGAMFATPGIKVGLFCSTPGVAIARSMTSTKKVMEMLLTGDPLSVNDALQYGLINYIVREEELEKETEKLAERIIKHSGCVLGLGKVAFYEQIDMSEKDAYDYTEKVMIENLQKEDAQEGLNAFIEKRQPKWK